MKYIDDKDLDRVPGRRLTAGDTFCFRCHPEIACFNRCCRNLNLFLYPYDVMRLKNCLQIDSDEFIERHVDVVLREGHYFPEVLLRMAENQERTCPFLSAGGCSVYAHRPDTCRTFPVEQGALFDADSGKSTPVYYFRPPDFCLGPREEQQWTVDSWTQDQEAERYHRMTRRWAEIRRLFQNDPWGVEGPQGAKARMAFMAAYNLDRFRDFLFASTFFKRYRVKPELKRKLRTSDQELMVFGFEWIKFFVWGIQSKQIRVK
jgi:hypothetical protein